MKRSCNGTNTERHCRKSEKRGVESMSFDVVVPVRSCKMVLGARADPRDPTDRQSDGPCRCRVRVRIEVEKKKSGIG